MQRMVYGLLFCIIYLYGAISLAHTNLSDIERLQDAYPEHIIAISNKTITWADGACMPLDDQVKNKSPQQKLESPALRDQIEGVVYEPGIPSDLTHFSPTNDPGRIRYLPFFMKMYGQTEEEVIEHLTVIYWMPAIFGTLYPLEVTRVNQVDKQLVAISHELEKLVQQHPEYIPFLEAPGGTFKWRNIANTDRLSAHSFGMTIDINSNQSDYWQWDLEKVGLPISEDAPLIYKNSIPWEIISIFEKYGFIWGGKWQHYDSMHFEYRPELFVE